MHQMACIHKTSELVEGWCCIKSWKGNKKTPAGGVKKGNIKTWRILKKNNNLYLHMAWWWAASLLNFPYFCSVVMMTVLAMSFPVETVSYFPRCAAAAEVFPSVKTSKQLPAIPWLLHNRRQKSLKHKDFDFWPLSLWPTWPHTQKQHL